MDLGGPKTSGGKFFFLFRPKWPPPHFVSIPRVHLLFGYLCAFDQKADFHWDSRDSESPDFLEPQTDHRAIAMGAPLPRALPGRDTCEAAGKYGGVGSELWSVLLLCVLVA